MIHDIFHLFVKRISNIVMWCHPCWDDSYQWTLDIPYDIITILCLIYHLDLSFLLTGLFLRHTYIYVRSTVNVCDSFVFLFLFCYCHLLFFSFSFTKEPWYIGISICFFGITRRDKYCMSNQYNNCLVCKIDW
jgi:hypothetical protein